MGSLWQVTGPSLSVWQCMVVFVSGGNPARERGRRVWGQGERGGDGRLENSNENQMDQKWAFPYRSCLVEFLFTQQTIWAVQRIVYWHHTVTDCPNWNPATGLWSGQGLRKEQGRAQGPILSTGSRCIDHFHIQPQPHSRHLNPKPRPAEKYLYLILHLYQEFYNGTKCDGNLVTKLWSAWSMWFKRHSSFCSTEEMKKASDIRHWHSSN